MDAQGAIVKETYKPGDFIFFEGDIENHFYIVESGVVSIFTKDQMGKRIPICDIVDGESFGEFALISKSPRSASAQAVTDVVLVKVSEEGFQQLLSELPTWAECMLKSFTDRLQNMTEKIREAEQFRRRES
ncbi:Crp/Fnr family transcriptional regulator [Bdellovibrio bacteriovorus]|uniref:Hyperpolarization-activated, cyclic nucleotide-gated K n=1 Tax=Bdellovibrio bacteriovorus str. Tiberius TaxID=1069642 RepID=K7ZBG0_BDEBC|nr:cyclic nucleotide-binding domain-containing protein [Bdellovibrio bacteriovorus]AFY02314.1 hyperpolarization-activated, cyclic nucleotide-gated K+ [Bdellovibrio bacteriovorus str. Tiberius]